MRGLIKYSDVISKVARIRTHSHLRTLHTVTSSYQNFISLKSISLCSGFHYFYIIDSKVITNVVFAPVPLHKKYQTPFSNEFLNNFLSLDILILPNPLGSPRRFAAGQIPPRPARPALAPAPMEHSPASLLSLSLCSRRLLSALRSLRPLASPELTAQKAPGYRIRTFI